MLEAILAVAGNDYDVTSADKRFAAGRQSNLRDADWSLGSRAWRVLAQLGRK
jgi:hypothetical protein